MNTSKKNQHYIPKFYLRNFSYKGNKKQIGVFNILNQKFIESAKLKTQGSKNFFYGIDGKIEDSLADIEGELAKSLKNIISSNTLPKQDSKEYFDLMIFIALTDLRNPVRIDGMKNMFKEMGNRLKSLVPNEQIDKFIPKLSEEDAIKISLKNTTHIAHMILDLEYKLLINDTNRPFISSDYPIVKYNQYLEVKKWPNSKTGYGLTGLQIFIPLNSKTLLTIYDSGIYKIGNRKQKICNLTDPKNVDDLNILQFVNCFDTIFFDERATENYIRVLFEQSKKYERANATQAELNYLIKEGEDYEKIKAGKENLIIMNSTDCETNLKIDIIKIHSRGKSHKLNPTMAQLRPHAERIRNSR